MSMAKFNQFANYPTLSLRTSKDTQIRIAENVLPKVTATLIQI